MEIERIDYGDAIKKIVQDNNIDISEFQSKRTSSPEYASDKEKIKRIIKLAQDFFVSSLAEKGGTSSLSSPYTYLTEKRLLSTNLIAQMGLWYAPSQSQSFLSHFLKHGFSSQDLVDAGLAKYREGTKEAYSFFRDRLTIPIRDQLGNVIAFGARALLPDQEPKYLNSSESIIYEKSNTLYGIDNLKIGVKEHKAIIVVEGYFDVIALSQGWYNIGVATCGTSLTAQHIKTLKRYSDTIYFLFDNDQAGVSATLRWLGIAYSQSIYPKIISLSDSGTESNVTKQNIKDIDDLVRNNPNAHEDIQMLIQSAQDWFLRAISYCGQNYQTNSPVEKQKTLNTLFDLIHAVESLSTQHSFIEQMAQTFRIDYTLLLSQYKQYIKKEKRIFWPRVQSVWNSTLVEESNKRDTKYQQSQDKDKLQNKLGELLHALLVDDFASTLNIDTERIQSVKKFVSLYSHNSLSWWNSVDQLRREKETESFLTVSGATTAFAKKVLGPHFLELQKTAITKAAPEDRQAILQLGATLR